MHCALADQQGDEATARAYLLQYQQIRKIEIKRTARCVLGMKEGRLSKAVH